jgi:hypothetical protein
MLLGLGKKNKITTLCFCNKKFIVLFSIINLISNYIMTTQAFNRVILICIKKINGIFSYINIQLSLICTHISTPN